MMVSMLASSSRAMVSSRRCCCVRGMSGKRFRGFAAAGAKEAAGLRRRPVAIAELTVAEDHAAVDAGSDDRGVVAVDHAAQVAVKRHLLLVIGVNRAVEAGWVDHHEVGPIALAQ